MARLFILFLLSALSHSFVSADVAYFIDCGSTFGKTDGFDTVWRGDGDLISNGVIQSVQSSNADSDPIMDTLRVFTTGIKNCYAFDVEEGERIVVRASFKYGNYDNKSSPPTFDLQFDGNFWTTVETSNDEVVAHEVTYVVKKNVASVCVAQTKADQFPFISAIEVRSTDSDVYSNADPSYALLLQTRVAYGADAVIRVSNDYDRTWTPAILGDGLINVTNNALDFIITGESPPIEVLRNAITTSTTSDALILASGFSSDVVSVYISMFFSEPTEVTKTRSFKLYVDNQEASDTNIEPPYANVEHDRGTIDVSSNTTLSLVATTGSELPPLINAMELFYVSKDQLTNGTHADDLEALGLLQTTFPALQDYSDPCLPATFTWDWLECSNDSTPRVTALHLDSYGLTGSLPDLSSMIGLKTIDLHNNSFTGDIPDYLGTLPNLKELNLADNQLSGSIPTVLSENKKIKLNVAGNPNLCTSGKSCDDATTTTTTNTNTDTFDLPTRKSSSTTGKKKNKKLPVILGTTIPLGLFGSAFVSLLAWLRHKKKKLSKISKRHAGSGQNYGGGSNGEPVIEEIKVDIENELVDEASDVTIQEEPILHNSTS
ncbi:putative LRR receptor-like serine/threonine-protein kinase [Heracleum sosnowskyi]|uniref:LRR receptor-like serine/threonine-protein kinase n=1 Tax=Heracleum sosnowskyi TaxID=360622 RepID=A0AAD8HVU8_9APIA|nr:putative LRR receptor-like serine/threonine-protein kinase [Heracleum sosnowskyi]